MKIKEVLATKYVHPDVETQLKKIEKRASKVVMEVIKVLDNVR